MADEYPAKARLRAVLVADAAVAGAEISPAFYRGQAGPQGPKGDAGPQGPKGDPGDSSRADAAAERLLAMRFSFNDQGELLVTF